MPFDSPSSSSSDQSATEAESKPVLAGAPLANSVWRPVVSFGGALAIGLIMASVFLKPISPSTNQEDQPEIILPRETTMIVRPSMPPGQLLRGQLKLVADVMGTSPITGEVARQIVEPGTRVKKGDPVVEISSGNTQRAAPAAENAQNKAEQSQIEASDAQSKLAQNINIAQVKLRTAQDRLDRSQVQVSAARDLVRRLQNGETVSSEEIPATYRSGSVPAAQPKPTKEAPVVDRAGEIALRQAEAAKDAATQGAQRLKMARQMLAEAQKTSKRAVDDLAACDKAVTDVEARFDDKKASGADVDQARTNQRNAKSVVTATDKAVKTAVADEAKQEKAAADLQKYADKAAADAKTALKGAVLFPKDDAPAATPVSVTRGKASLDQAIKFAGDALEESRRASLAAEKLHTEIDSYKRQVSNSSARIEETSHDLATAQQTVLNSVPRASFTPAFAPVDGVVTWMSRLARDVKAGDSVYGIARGGQMGAQFEDKGDLWRGLKVGSTLPGMVVTASKIGAKAVPTEGDQSPVQLQVTAIRPPDAVGEAAIVDCAVAINPMSSTGQDMEVVASIPQPGQKPTLSVPTASLVHIGNDTFVAVLSPFIGRAETAISTPVTPSPISTLSTVPSQTPPPLAAGSAEEKNRFRLEWKKVFLGRTDGLRSEILSGLNSGNRVVAQPEQLQESGFSPEPAAPRGVGEAAQPQEVSSKDVLVRLTGASA